ncbi:Brain protein I3, putative [Pediculus humanus corporis]|uniref:Membrane protein BRI3 n=1 Tax=Pediculus humanus subsp. corporis TaxID=121224 RepID=E0VYU3_PEDHC|nr:Brain protein I3, putative [Pediculus humanus corporis]EEB18549.1 Brain protein I3, putative [Pediculus humanus corporis]
MTDVNNFEKPFPSAPPPYSAYPTEVQQYGFQTPVTQQPNYTPQQYIPTPTFIQPSPVNQTVVIMGGCPSCRTGTLESDFTCCGILCAIFCFPIGILCCLCMKQKKCNQCGATF